MKVARTSKARLRSDGKVVTVAVLEDTPVVVILARRDLIMLQRLFHDLDRLKLRKRVTPYAAMQRRVREALDTMSGEIDASQSPDYQQPAVEQGFPYDSASDDY